MILKSRKFGILLSFVNTFLNAISGLILSSFLIRFVGSSNYGLYQIASTFINYLVLLEFGTGTVITRNLSISFSKKRKKDDINKNISTIWYISIILSIIIFVFAIIFYFLFDEIYLHSLDLVQIIKAKNMLIYLVFYLIFSFLLQTLNGIILAYENYSFSSIISIIKTILRVILVLTLVFFTNNIIVVSIVDMAISFFIFIYTFIYCKKKYCVSFSIKSFDVKILKASFPLCFAIFLQAIVNQANSNVDKTFISLVMTPMDVSIYSVALYIYSMFSTVGTIPISMYSPQINQKVALNVSTDTLKELLIKPSRLIVFVLGTILFGFICAGRQFIIIVYGIDYIDAWLIAIILMIPAFINMSNGVIVNVLDALNKRIVRSVFLLVTTLFNIILTYYFINNYGMIGAALATLICTFIGQIFTMNFYYYIYLKLPIFKMFKETFKGIIVYQIFSMVVVLFFSQFINNLFVSFLFCGLIYLLLSITLIYLFGINKEEKNKIKVIFSLLKNKYKK